MTGLKAAAFVALGGAIGALARWGVSQGIGVIVGRAYVPIGTLLVNVIGCGLIGYIAGRAGSQNIGWLISNRPLMVTGFCGALTTFSTFGLETVELYERRPTLGIGLVMAHLALGLAAVVIGQRLASVGA